MKAKRYPVQNARQGKTEPRVEEVSGRYGRVMSRKAALSPGVSLAQAKKRLGKPVKRDAKEIRWAMGIAGIGAGPTDLSENMRSYLRGDK